MEFGLLAEETTSMSQALANTGIGMGTVFVVLILISFIIFLMRYIPKFFEKKEEKPLVSSPAPQNLRTKQVAKQEETAGATDDYALVAVITAAIYADMEANGVPVPKDGLVIRSIKPR